MDGPSEASPGGCACRRGRRQRARLCVNKSVAVLGKCVVVLKVRRDVLKAASWSLRDRTCPPRAPVHRKPLVFRVSSFIPAASNGDK